MNIKLLGLLGAAVLFAGCAKTAEVKTPVNMKAKNYAEALQSADKSCKVDEDCTSVNKGCCLCHGNEAVNKDAAAALKPIWEKNVPWPPARCRCAMWKLTLRASRAPVWAPPNR